MKCVVILIFLLASCKHNFNSDYLVRITQKHPDGLYYGYASLKGDTIIPLGRYLCWTDTFKNTAIVYKPHVGNVCIDRSEKVLFEVYNFDNGPDYPSDGLYRIIKDGKVGYADTNNTIVIQPQFGCAFPFEKGLAKVSLNCAEKVDGEHRIPMSSHWFYINRSGLRAKNRDDSGSIIQ